jgi:hypothetical protein
VEHIFLAFNRQRDAARESVRVWFRLVFAGAQYGVSE